jgi:hypothetical protein
MQGCTVSDKIAYRDVFNIVGDSDVFFDGCTFQATSAPSKTFYLAHNPDFNSVRSLFRNCWVAPQAGGGYKLDDDPPRTFSLPPRIQATAQTRAVTDNAGRYVYVPGSVNTQRTIPASGYSFTATQLTFTTAYPELFITGDLLLWPLAECMGGSLKYTVPAVRVASVVSSTVTCHLLFPRSSYDETYAPKSISTAVTEWAPGQPLRGDLISGNADILNVSPTGVLRVGDWLKSGSGIPNDARVAAVVGSKVTMNKPATATKASVALLWGQLRVLTTSPAF